MDAEKVLGSKTEEVTGDWRKLHYEELHGCRSSTNIILVNRWDMWHV